MAPIALRSGFLPADEYLNQPREAESFIIKPLIPLSGACLMYGAAKGGKSFMAIQLALALSGQMPDWLGFPITMTGPVCYLQLDTPRQVWATRFDEVLRKHKVKYDSSKLLLADRESIAHYPFDILQPLHTKYLFDLVQGHRPIAVIVDTLREVHSGDENDSTVARNVIANLVGATHPAALILISHDRKPNPDAHKDLLADHRGSSYVTGRMDAILRLTKTALYYTGRSIEEGNIKLQRLDSGLWAPKIEEADTVAMAKVLSDPQLGTLRAKARVLATLIGTNEDAALSRIRRFTSKPKPIMLVQGNSIINTITGEELSHV